MLKHRENGEFGLMDQRGRRKEYLDQERYVQKLKRENALLKKCLVIWNLSLSYPNAYRSTKSNRKVYPFTTENDQNGN